MERMRGRDVAIEKITPEVAAEWLQGNVKNRDLGSEHMRRLASDMAAGAFTVANLMVRTWSGLLVDGQHRLLMCVQTGVTFEAVVLYLDDAEAESVRLSMDRGRPRSIADHLKYRDEVNSRTLAAAVSLGWAIDTENHDLSGHRSPTPSQAREWLDEHPRIREALHPSWTVAKEAGAPATPFAVFVERAWRVADDQIVDAFVSSLRTGSTEEADPCVAYRRWLRGRKELRQVIRGPEHLAVIIKVWNAWVEAMPMRQVRWRRIGPGAEPFPSITAPDDA